jgi:predicted small secreted protein
MKPLRRIAEALFLAALLFAACWMLRGFGDY